MTVNSLVAPRACALLPAVALFFWLLAPVQAVPNQAVKVSPDLIKEDLYRAFFVSPDEGWVVGTFGRVYHTDDGGESWTKQRTGMLVPLFSVSFSDAKHGWAVGKAGTILRTEDGGLTWQQQSSPQGKHLFAVAAVSATTAWVVGDWGMIAMTTDGGATWQDRSLTEDIILYGIDFADQKHGWIAGEVGHLWFTEDGGQTWTRHRTANKKSLFGVHIADRERAWAVGLDGEIWQFVGGEWKYRQSGAEAALYDVVVDGEDGWAVGDSGTALVTKDGGLTWQDAEVPDDLKLFWMHSVSVMAESGKRRGLIAGANGLLLWTKNGQINTTK